MKKLTLLTSRHRVIDVEIGQPITALADGEVVVSIERRPHPDEGALTAADDAWIIAHVVPLMPYRPSP